MNLSIISMAFVSTLLFLTERCDQDDFPKGTPECVREKINEIAGESVWNPPAKVYSYMYNEQKVFFIPSHCCDIPSQVYDENCNLICAPDGGITGAGDGKCSDFFSTRTNELLVWEDTR